MNIRSWIMQWPAWIALSTLLVGVAGAQNIKMNPASTRDILEARWVAVVAYTGSEVPVASPQENQGAVRDVQVAILKWGRYQITADPAQADLIIAVRKGRAGGLTVNGSRNPTPVIINPDGSGGTIAIHKGQIPPLSRGEAPDTRPRPSVGAQAGPGDDLFEIYRGRTEYPLDDPPIWRYLAKNGLQAPKVEAVVKFRKAVEEAEKKKP